MNKYFYTLLILVFLSVFSCNSNTSDTKTSDTNQSSTSLQQSNTNDMDNPLLKKVLHNKIIRENNPTIKIMTYNMASGAKTLKIDASNTAAAIKKVSPDLVALQEVDVNTARSGNVDQIKIISEITGYYSYFAKTIDFDGGDYGIAILSKYPIIYTHVLQLPSSDEQRVALITKIDVPNFDVPITFINTHTDWHENPETRMSQIYAIDEYLLDVRGIKIMCGDFNDTINSDTIKRLERYWKCEIPSSIDNRTWPSENPEIGLDYIFTSKAQVWDADVYIPNKENSAEADGVEWTSVSDHLPVIATLKLLEQ